MEEQAWSAVVRFAEHVCGTLGSAEVQQRGLPELVRLTRSDSGAIHLLDHRFRSTLATTVGAPLAVLYEFEELSRRSCEYLRRSFATQFPVHDTMIHQRIDDHLRSPQGQVLARHGFEHCMLVPLVRNGRTIGTITLARRKGSPPFALAEQRIADRLAPFVALALTNAAVHEAAVGAKKFDATVVLKSYERGVQVETTWLGDALSVAVQAEHRSKVVGLEGVLTGREIEVLELVSSGLMNIEIAAELGIALNTVKQHLKHIYRKLGARSRFEALRNSERAELLV